MPKSVCVICEENSKSLVMRICSKRLCGLFIQEPKHLIMPESLFHRWIKFAEETRIPESRTIARTVEETKKWLPNKDSNLNKLNQNQLCYRYTIGQHCCRCHLIYWCLKKMQTEFSKKTKKDFAVLYRSMPPMRTAGVSRTAFCTEAVAWVNCKSKCTFAIHLFNFYNAHFRIFSSPPA